MNYNVKIACENQAKVINFTIEDSCLSTNTITQVFNGVVKDNYTVSVGLGCKKHRGKAVPFIKAIAVARGFVAPTGINLVCIPAFQNILIDNEERTAIRLIVESK